jgi:hypothetical protein
MRKAPWIILVALTCATVFGVRTAQAVQSFTAQVSCATDPEFVIITNTGNQNIDLGTFRIVTKYETRAGEEITLSGTLQPGLSTRIEAGTSSGNPGAQRWTQSFVFDDRFLFQEGLIILVGGQQYEVPCGAGTNTGSFTLPDASGLVPTVTPTVTITPSVTVTPSATSASGQNIWYDIPPTLPGAVSSCPPAEAWRLVYWGGQSTPIQLASAVCGIDVAWLNRQGTWYGFAPDFVDQRDSWSQLPSEVAVLHGKVGAATVGSVAPNTPSVSPTLTLPGGTGATATATVAPTQTIVGSGTAIAPGPVGPPTIQIVDFTSEVQRDGTARLLVRTVPFVTCTLSYGPPPSRIPVTVQNAGPRPVDANGYISWSWKIEPNVPTGIGGVAVTCRDVTATLDIRIT